MKALAVGLSGAVLLALAAGCSPQLAQEELGETEMQWNSIVRESYPGFRPPRTAPPAVQDKNTPLQAVVPENEQTPPEANPVENTEIIETNMTETLEEPIADPEIVDEPAVETETVAVEETVKTEMTDEAAPETPVKPEVKEPQPEGKFVEYVVKPGDTLSGIAKKFYKDGRLYDRIYEANKSIIPDPNRLPLGLKIRIPQQ